MKHPLNLEIASTVYIAGSNSIATRGDIVWLNRDEIIVEVMIEMLEGGSPFVRRIPTVEHDLVDAYRALSGTRHPISSFHLLDHFPVVHA